MSGLGVTNIHILHVLFTHNSVKHDATQAPCQIDMAIGAGSKQAKGLCKQGSFGEGAHIALCVQRPL